MTDHPFVYDDDDERERIVQSNAVAGIVIDEFKLRFPGVHPVLDLRYGIADALWNAGYRLRCICAELLPVGEEPSACPRHGWIGEPPVDVEVGSQ